MKKLASKQGIFFESNLMSEVISNDHLDAAMHFIYERRAKRDCPDVLSDTPQCRRFVKKMHHSMHLLHFKLALDKTFIGRIQTGFDFLGYHFHPRVLSLARKTVLNFIDRITVLYEQKCERQRISQYVRRWFTWVTAGLSV